MIMHLTHHSIWAVIFSMSHVLDWRMLLAFVIIVAAIFVVMYFKEKE